MCHHIDNYCYNSNIPFVIYMSVAIYDSTNSKVTNVKADEARYIRPHHISTIVKIQLFRSCLTAVPWVFWHVVCTSIIIDRNTRIFEKLYVVKDVSVYDFSYWLLIIRIVINKFIWFFFISILSIFLKIIRNILVKEKVSSRCEDSHQNII